MSLAWAGKTTIFVVGCHQLQFLSRAAKKLRFFVAGCHKYDICRELPQLRFLSPAATTTIFVATTMIFVASCHNDDFCRELPQLRFFKPKLRFLSPKLRFLSRAATTTIF